jgi:hypothetical protein
MATSGEKPMAIDRVLDADITRAHGRLDSEDASDAKYAFLTAAPKMDDRPAARVDEALTAHTTTLASLPLSLIE